MDDVIDLDATVEASWGRFEQEYAAAVRELRPGQHLLASIDDGYVDDDDEDGGYGMEATPSVMTLAWDGEVGVIVLNAGDAPFTVERGMRIAQAVVAPVLRAAWREVAELLAAMRRAMSGISE